MDEPCSALDPIATAQVEELIDELRASYSVVIVTHSMQQAARVSQKTAFFHLGNLVEYGMTPDIFTNPRDPRTEAYISAGSDKESGHERTPHRHAFDRDLESLQATIIKMGGLVEDAILNGAEALLTRDTEKAEQVRKGDKAIDALEDVVNDEAVRLMALRQPVSTDLRLVVSTIKLAQSLERMGDYAKNIAKRTSVLAELKPISGGDATLRRMAREVQGMLKDTLDSFVRRDTALARDVVGRDQDVTRCTTRCSASS